METIRTIEILKQNKILNAKGKAYRDKKEYKKKELFYKDVNANEKLQTLYYRVINTVLCIGNKKTRKILDNLIPIFPLKVIQR